MKKFRILALVLAMIMLVSALTACGNKDKTDGGSSKGNTDAAQTYTGFPEKLTAEKIGSIDDKYIATAEGGIYYKTEDNKYGIMTADGKKDTGAKYVFVDPKEQYFAVATTMPTDYNTPSALNCFGLVDATGKEIIPQKYASIDILNERYVRVCEVTEKTDSKDDMLVYFTEKTFSLQASDDDILYKGNWYVYDITTGKQLEGITGTKSYNMYAYGDCLRYVTDAEEEFIINSKGEKIPEDADLFDNGYYALIKDNEGAVYDSNNKKAFTYALDGFVPYDSLGEYIVARQDGDTRKYVFMDKSGKVVSGEFSDQPELFGKLVFVGKKVYDLKANNIIEGEFENVYIDEMTENSWMLKSSDDKYTLIKEDGTVLYEGVDSEPVSIDPYGDFSFAKKVDDKRMLYSLKDKDYTIEGNSLYAWLIQATKPNNIYDVVDSISGDTIISGYTDYEYVAIDGVVYVYAEKADGGLDVFKVK